MYVDVSMSIFQIYIYIYIYIYMVVCMFQLAMLTPVAGDKAKQTVMSGV